MIDLSESHVWDESAILTLMKVKDLLASKGVTVSFVGLNATSLKLIERITGSATI